MFEKLEWMMKRFEELTTLISDPQVIADREKWQQLVKEHSQMEGTIELYKKYLAVQNNIAECKEIIEDGSDEDMTALAKEELHNAQKESENLDHFSSRC